MRITFEFTPDDVWQYALYHRRHKIALRTIFLCVFAVLIGLACATGFWGIGVALFHHRPLDWVSLSLLILMAYCMTRILPPTKNKVVKAQRPGMFGEHTVEVSPEWFFEKTSMNETKNAWVTFESVEENQRYLFLFLSKNIAFIVPKRAFTSPNEAQAFLDTSRRYFDAAKTRTPITAEDVAVWPPAPRPKV